MQDERSHEIPAVDPARSPEPGQLPQPTLLTLLRSVERAVTAQVVSRIAQAGYPGLSSTHGKVFPFVGEAGSRVADMARAAGVTKQTMAEFVGLLERQGYVERKPDPSDQRAKLVVLTERGREVVATGVLALADARKQVARAIGEDGVTQLIGLLARIEEQARDWPETERFRQFYAAGSHLRPALPDGSAGRRSRPLRRGGEGSTHA